MTLTDYIGKSAKFDHEIKIAKFCYQKLDVFVTIKDITKNTILLECNYLFKNGAIFDYKIKKLKLQGDENTKYFKLDEKIHVLSNFN